MVLLKHFIVSTDKEESINCTTCSQKLYCGLDISCVIVDIYLHAIWISEINSNELAAIINHCHEEWMLTKCSRSCFCCSIRFVCCLCFSFRIDHILALCKSIAGSSLTKSKYMCAVRDHEPKVLVVLH